MVEQWFNSAFVSSENSVTYSCLVDSLWIPSQEVDSLHYISRIPSQKSVFLHTNLVPSFWPGLSEKLLFRNLFQMLLFCTFQFCLQQICPKFWIFSMFGWTFTSSGAHTVYSLNFGMDWKSFVGFAICICSESTFDYTTKHSKWHFFT